MEKYAFLERSLGLFENEEPWMGPHLAVMASYDRADVVDQQCIMMSALFRCLHVNCRQFSRRLTSSDARKLCDLWTQWYSRASDLMLEVRQLGDDLFHVPNADVLRESYAQAGAFIDAVKKLAKSIEEVDQGKYLDLEGLMDVIRT